MTPPVVKHLEHHLGKSVGGWGGTSPIKILRFPDRPVPGVVTYATLGLSDAILAMPGGRTVREELLLAVYESVDGAALAGMLMTFAEYVAKGGRALLRGDVVGPSDPILPSVRARAIYATLPVAFEDGIETLSATTPPTVFVWLLPVPASDAHFVKSRGWEAFEDRLEAQPVDLWDLNRAGVVDPG